MRPMSPRARRWFRSSSTAASSTRRAGCSKKGSRSIRHKHTLPPCSRASMSSSATTRLRPTSSTHLARPDAKTPTTRCCSGPCYSGSVGTPKRPMPCAVPWSSRSSPRRPGWRSAYRWKRPGKKRRRSKLIAARSSRPLAIKIRAATRRCESARYAERRGSRRGQDLPQPIAVVVDRDDPVARLGPQIELLAHLAHVRVHGARGEIAGAPPHRFLQMPTREQPPHIAKQGHRELELLRRKLDRRAVLADFAALQVDVEGREGKLLLLLHRVGAPQQRAHPSQKLLAAHRLHHVVVGPALKRKHDVLLGVAHGDEEHRHGLGDMGA